MRRSNEEFKQEILRRKQAYLIRQKKIRRNILTGALCLSLLCGGVIPFTRGSFDNSTPEAAPMEPALEYIADHSLMNGATAAEQPPGAPAAEESGTVFIALTDEDAAVISAYLAGEWVYDLTNCLCDYEFVIGVQHLHYHSDCGMIADYEQGCSMILDEETRLLLNEILKSY